MVISRRRIIQTVLALPFTGAVRSVFAGEPEKFYVIGFVKSPGSYTHRQGLTVADALELAGGIEAGRTISTLQIVRPDQNGMMQRIDANMNDAVLANDTVRAR
jgi:protein involved in polysaccharide export with SLBB domain